MKKFQRRLPKNKALKPTPVTKSLSRNSVKSFRVLLRSLISQISLSKLWKQMNSKVTKSTIF